MQLNNKSRTIGFLQAFEESADWALLL